MLELINIATVLSRREDDARDCKRASALHATFRPVKPQGRSHSLPSQPARPLVARALGIKEGDLIVAARGAATDVCMANETVFGAFVSLDLYLNGQCVK